MRTLLRITTLCLFYQFSVGLSQTDEVSKKCLPLFIQLQSKDSLLVLEKKKSDSLVEQNQELSASNAILQTKITEFEKNSLLIQIGTQRWESQNLKVNQLNDGTLIYHAQTREEWDSLFIRKLPAYCKHKSDSLDEFGYMYNYYAVKSGKLAPHGFKIPDRSDYEILKQFISGVSNNGAALLKASNLDKSNFINWETPGSDAFGLGIRPFGFRVDNTTEWYIKNKIYFWCQPESEEELILLVFSEINDLPFLLEKNINDVNVNYGLYVRCIKK